MRAQIFIFAIIILLLAVPNTQSVDCQGFEGSISWFAAIQFPTSVYNDSSYGYGYNDYNESYVYNETSYDYNDTYTPDIHTQKNFIYYDSTETQYQSFYQLNYTTDDATSPITKSLVQSQNSNMLVLAWNDGNPLDSSNYSFAVGHTKGVIVLDLSTNNGFYLVHSMPNFPNITNGQIDPTVPNTAKKYGQNFFCMSMTGADLEALAGQLYIEYPGVYFSQQISSANGYPNLQQLGSLQTNPPPAPLPENKSPDLLGNIALTNTEYLKGMSFTTRLSGGITVQAFTKSGHNSNSLIYEDLMTPRLNTSFVAESWGRPWQAPTCNIEGQYNVNNIQSLSYSSSFSWSSYDDHSKWGISTNSQTPWVCNGDMNRMISQDIRGGSFFCITQPNLWQAYNTMIQTTDNCSTQATQIQFNKKSFLTK